MRKLKLQMQITIDGFVARRGGQLDWMWLGEKDEATFQKAIDMADACDTILLGRKMTREFIDYWENVVDNHAEEPLYTLGKRMVDMQKIVFSRTQVNIKGRNLQTENGDIVTRVQALKQETGKDIIVYGGANFVSSLIGHDLIDEYYFSVNPVAIGEGMRIFMGQKILKLESSFVFGNGKIWNKYLPV